MYKALKQGPLSLWREAELQTLHLGTRGDVLLGVEPPSHKGNTTHDLRIRATCPLPKCITPCTSVTTTIFMSITSRAIWGRCEGRHRVGRADLRSRVCYWPHVTAHESAGWLSRCPSASNALSRKS